VLQNRWIILAALFAARAGVGFQYQTVASTAPLLRAELGLGIDAIGVLIGLYFATGMFLALPAGAIGARFGSRACVLFGLALMVVGSAAAGFSHGWGMHVAARIVAGAGGVFVTVFMTKMVTDWFAGRDMATAMGIFVNSWPVGIALALVTMPALGAAWGAGGVFLVSAAVCALGFALVALVYRDPPLARGEAPPPAAWPKGATLPLVTLAACVWGFFNVGFAMVFSFGPAMLIDRGMSAVLAGSAVSVVLWLSILSVPAGGALADRTGRPRTLIALGQMVGAALIVAASMAGQPTLLFALLGLIVGLPAGPIMALPGQVLRVEERATGMGLFYAIYYALMVAGPIVAALIARTVGSTAFAFQMGAAFMLCATLSLAAFTLLQRRASA
jgi:MFS family permease